MTDKNSSKPLTPTLSAAFNRSNKSPLTPKIARPGGYSTTKRLTPSEHPSSSPSKEELTPTFLSANVTPRSGSRNSRRDALSSPTNTPTNNSSPQLLPQPIVIPGSNYGYRPDRSPGQSGRLDPRTARAKTLTAENVPRSNPHDNTSPRFFHASDARSNVDSDLRSKEKLPPSFFYANGQGEDLAVEPNASIPGMNRRSTGVPRPISVAKSSAASSPRLRSPNHSDAARLTDELRSQTSPPEIASDRSPQFEQLPISSLNKLPDKLPDRPRFSIGRHTKSTSLDSAQNSTPPREGLRPSPVIISPSDSPVDVIEEPPPLRPRILSNGSTASADVHASIQSPTKSDVTSPGKPDPAINARTERKILDLEISNSSLLAINRTLEHEMRKQNAELRRYRRLSRSGRLSMALSNRSVSGGGLSVTSETDEGLSDFSPHLPQNLSDISDEESVDEDDMSSSEHDAQQQARDEKRFYVDLAKHQELLVTSHKMDQSIRRCLGWTEELIIEGRKALDYCVQVSDVELGGRVLSPDEVDVGEGNRGLLSPTYEIPEPLPDPITLDPSATDRPVTETAGSTDPNDSTDQLVETA
ncbi:hypothetical protein PHISCL_05833 [Aspergillus sclerotialis]|uniref:Uncharacterized protein n=1 Tax=Aspergillus sclerotialis TaxID=2070753 RepID=A0A3A2ZR76_9EURO|nr:hypothetical protein PHISCL_05833 [Aspergillus sclerotialis]